MGWSRITLFLSLLAALSLVGCDSAPRINTLQAGEVVLAFGDSLTYGTGAERNQAYPAILSELLALEVVNAGVPGELSAEGRRRLGKMLEKYDPALLILCHGGNDFLRRHDIGQTRENVKAMVEMARGRGVDVVLLGVPKLGWGLGVPEFYGEIAKEYSIPFEAEILVELLGDNSKKSDTIHPNAAGYRLLAEAIYRVVDEAQ